MTDEQQAGTTLPYDVARCVGREWPECRDCERRTAPARPDGWQTYMVARETRPHPAWRCDARIARDATPAPELVRAILDEALDDHDDTLSVGAYEQIVDALAQPQGASHDDQ